jgi:hypothetical protein
VFLQSDIEDLMQDMVGKFQTSNLFERASTDTDLLVENTTPLIVQTEREQLTLDKGLPVFRASFERKRGL